MVSAVIFLRKKGKHQILLNIEESQIRLNQGFSLLSFFLKKKFTENHLNSIIKFYLECFLFSYTSVREEKLEMGEKFLWHVIWKKIWIKGLFRNLSKYTLYKKMIFILILSWLFLNLPSTFDMVVAIKEFSSSSKIATKCYICKHKRDIFAKVLLLPIFRTISQSDISWKRLLNEMETSS